MMDLRCKATVHKHSSYAVIPLAGLAAAHKTFVSCETSSLATTANGFNIVQIDNSNFWKEMKIIFNSGSMEAIGMIE